MNNINELFNEKLGSNFSKVNEHIEYSKFKNQRRKINIKKICRNLVLVTTSCILIVFLIPILIFGLKVDNSFKTTYKNYTIHELNQMENEVYQRLNNVNYPELEEFKKTYDVEEEYVSSLNNFAKTITSSMDLTKENVIYSPLSLYMNLDIMSSLTNDSELINEFNALLGEKQIRERNYDAMFKNNYYKVFNGTVMAHNGLFATNKYAFNESLLDELTKKYVEVFQLDYQNEAAVKKMLEWVNNKVDSDNLFNENDLKIDQYYAFSLFSTLYFKNKWSTNFDKKDTYNDLFYGLNGITEQKYMKHTFYTKVYDYGDYLSFSDYYVNDYSIKYYVPKKVEDNIYDLIKNKNIFEDDETKLITYPHSYDDQVDSHTIVEFSLPKFKFDYSFDFTSLLKEKGLAKAFDINQKSFNHTFSNLDETTNIYLDQVLQKNQIEVNETGTTLKTITLAGACGGVAPGRLDRTLLIKLNQPFVYIISDSNGLPLYVGNVNNL